MLANDSDPDNDPLTLASFTQGAPGAVAQNGTLLTYTPADGFSGTHGFTYTISDGRGGTDTATVTVTVTVDPPPPTNEHRQLTARGKNVNQVKGRPPSRGAPSS